MCMHTHTQICFTFMESNIGHIFMGWSPRLTTILFNTISDKFIISKFSEYLCWILTNYVQTGSDFFLVWVPKKQTRKYVYSYHDLLKNCIKLKGYPDKPNVNWIQRYNIMLFCYPLLLEVVTSLYFPKIKCSKEGMTT